MKMLSKRAHQALDMTHLISSSLARRASRSDSQGKRPAKLPVNHRAFDPIAYAAALEVLG